MTPQEIEDTKHKIDVAIADYRGIQWLNDYQATCKVQQNLLKAIDLGNAIDGYGHDRIASICDMNYGEKILRTLATETHNKQALDILTYSDYPVIRAYVALRGHNLGVLVNDENEAVRECVARQGFGLQILVNDTNDDVVYEVARQGYELDRLAHHKSPKVRAEVARQGHALSRLVYDSSEEVRIEVAKQGHGLSRLVNDCSEKVRIEVARQGYKLDKLAKDHSRNVRITVVEQGYCDDRILRDKDPEVVKAYRKAMRNKMERQLVEPLDQLENSSAEMTNNSEKSGRTFPTNPFASVKIKSPFRFKTMVSNG